jgi:hypothetical protein
MNFGPFQALPRFRAMGDSKFIASCPTSAHPNGDRNQSLSGKLVDRKTLIKCHRGCTAKDILDAIGLDWSALFADRWQEPTAKLIRKQATLEGFRGWRESARQMG